MIEVSNNQKNRLYRQVFLITGLAVAMFAPLSAAVERVHFLIPGGAGGGWDFTARGTGEALTRAGIVESASYENMSGGDGSRAIAHLIETAGRQTDTLMISSSPIVLKSLRDIFPQSYKDLTPVATVIADYGAFVVARDSPLQNWNQVIEAFKQNPRNVKVAGGSVKGGMDHLVAALVFQKSGFDARQVRYIPYNAGAKAMVGLLSGETQLLSTGLGEALALGRQGEVRILAITAGSRVEQAPHVPTIAEHGIDMVFVNWRGFFAAPGIPAENIARFHKILEEMYRTSQWEKVRSSRGWTNLYIKGEAFVEFLAQQERDMSGLMQELGFR